MRLTIGGGGDLSGLAAKAGANALHRQVGISGGQMHQCGGLHIGHGTLFGGVGDFQQRLFAAWQSD